MLDGAPRFGLGIGKEEAEALKARSDDFLVTDLRSIAVQGPVAPEHLPPLAEAKAMLAWHARHRFCANCGAPTAAVEGGWKRECAVCKAEHFPRTDPVVIMLAVDGERCLLGRSARFASAMWSCLAEVLEFYRMAGDVDYMLRVVGPDSASYDAFSTRLIAAVPLKNVTSRFAIGEDQVGDRAADPLVRRTASSRPAPLAKETQRALTVRGRRRSSPASPSCSALGAGRTGPSG